MDKIKFWHEESVDFCVLVPRGTDPDNLASVLREAGIEVFEYNTKTSDYINCRTTKKIFIKFFDVKLKWRTIKIGSWELADDSYHLQDQLPIKEVLLKRNILFPPTFIKNWRLKKKDEQKT